MSEWSEQEYKHLVQRIPMVNIGYLGIKMLPFGIVLESLSSLKH